MIPEPSWPRMTGSPISPLRPSMSVWHRPAPAIRTRTSPGAGSRSCTSSIAYGASAALSTAALISTVSALQGVADGRVLPAAEERGGRPLRPTGHLDGFQPGQQLGREWPDLHPGEGGPAAQIHAEADR